MLQDDHGGNVRVLNVREEWKVSDSYNFTVRDLHTYFVVIDGTPILVHNGNADPPVPPGQSLHPPGSPSNAELLQQAIALRDALVDVIKVTGLKVQSGNWPPTVVGAVNTATGEVGAGATLAGRNLGGTCSETWAGRAVGVEPAPGAPVILTPAIRPRTGGTVPVCPDCQNEWGQGAFAPETTFDAVPHS